jgi:glycerophosphoryl diester phosphodiesterase
VALAQPSTVQAGEPGASPWLGGLDVDAPRFGGDVARAARAIGADVLSPTYGTGAWGTPAFSWYVTPAMIDSAHRLGLDVVPWTVNDPEALRQVMALDIDGVITDYPDRARVAMAERGIDLPRPYASPFDVQGHRGARAARPENTLPAFRYAIEAGVDTLELDTGLTEDGVLVVIHDRRVNGTHCADTGPAFPGDPEHPYAGRLIRDLTLAQLRTLDCGRTDPGFPNQVAQPGAVLPTLQEVFDLVEAADSDVRFNIETKISPTVDDTAPYDVFTRALVDAIAANGLEDRATIQSFDWRTIRLAKQLDPDIGTVALVWQFAGEDCDEVADECSLEAVVGDPSVQSPWTGGLDWWDFRDLGALVRAAGADVVSANWQVHDPHQGTVDSPDWYAKEDPAIYHRPSVRTLQRRGLKVIPYTINDEATMQRVIDLGVDGIISDDVDLLILVAKRNGLD